MPGDVEVELAGPDSARSRSAYRMPSWSNSGPASTSPSGRDDDAAAARRTSSRLACQLFNSGQIGGVHVLVTYWLQPSTKQRPSRAMWRRVACRVWRKSAVGARYSSHLWWYIAIAPGACSSPSRSARPSYRRSVSDTVSVLPSPSPQISRSAAVGLSLRCYTDQLSPG